MILHVHLLRERIVPNILKKETRNITSTFIITKIPIQSPNSILPKLLKFRK
jgi:hypothetical protein